MPLGKPLDKKALLRDMRGEEPGPKEETEPKQHSLLNPNVLIVPAKGSRKTPFEPEPDTERDEVLCKALDHLNKHGVSYTRLDVQQVVEASYGGTMEEFREALRTWIRELGKAHESKVVEERDDKVEQRIAAGMSRRWATYRGDGLVPPREKALPEEGAA